MHSLKDQSNKLIIDKLKSLKSLENSAQADLIMYLAEFDRRKLFRNLGYSSLFTYCTEVLGYSAGTAYTRVQAARCYNDNPGIYTLIRDGKLSICAISEIARVKETNVQKEIIVNSIGKTKDQVKILTAPHLPVENSKKDSIRPKLVKQVASPLFSSVDADKSDSMEKAGVVFNHTDTLKTSILKYNFSAEVDEEFMRLYKEAKEIVGHLPAGEVLKRVLRQFVKIKHSAPLRKTEVSVKNSRFIPKSVRYKVQIRDGRQCSYVSADGKRCSERHQLEFDHIEPFGMGGSNSVENIRLLCRAHNQLHAENCYPEMAWNFGRAKEAEVFYGNV